ncbi:MAG: type II toxin-antitoxin system YhaV family toxin [Ramlibacter sp.]
MNERTASGGWTLLAHPLFLDQLQDLVTKVEALQAKDPKGYTSKNATKRLKMVLDLMGEIQDDPTREMYRQGDTLGDEYKHWFRAKFFQQYRLFFRFHKSAKVVVLAWVNDDATLRAYESKSDAYRVFAAMLDEGRPPDSWEALIKEASGDGVRTNTLLAAAAKALPPTV